MHRSSLLSLLLIAACAGHPTPPPEAAPTPAPATPPPTVSQATPESDVVPAPVADSILDRELVEELRIAADSAADEAILDRLADLHTETPDSAAGDEPPAEESPSAADGTKALTNEPVRFDIDVARFNNHDRVQYYLDFYRTTGRERFGVWLSRMPRYEAMIRQRLQAEGLPGDLVYLALIESGFSNTATSRARAVGMWQFMKGTGRLYGLRVDRWVDERRDPIKATDAAARHLKDLTGMFGSYYLAAAAYNAGAGRVSRGLNRLPDDETDTIPSDATFFRLYDTKLLRRETKDYVPKLIAAAMIAKEPTKYGFPALSPEAAVPYDSIVVPDQTGLDVVARLADTTIAALRELNPQYLRLATPPARSSVVRLPPGTGDATALAYADLPAGKRVSYREHVVRNGETLGAVARRYGVAKADIIAANPRIRGNTVRAGQNLVIPTLGPLPAEVSRQLATEPTDADFHRVRRGENLRLIAGKYGVSQRQLQVWNRMGKSTRIRAGQRLRVSPPDGPIRVAAKAGSKATAKAATATAKTARRSHVVRQGDTLSGLARRYGVSVQALRAANGLSDDATLRRGVRLRIPA
jgi:membrane-bound lytic murein transglycosylase D